MRINIECVFGMLVNRWVVLRTPVPINVSIIKTTCMVHALCCLHNWIIDQNDKTDIDRATEQDTYSIIDRRGDNSETQTTESISI